MATNIELLESIDRKLSVLIEMQAYEIVGELTITQGAPLLKRLGMTPSEIAKVFDTTAKTVSVRISEAKKKSS